MDMPELPILSMIHSSAHSTIVSPHTEVVSQYRVSDRTKTYTFRGLLVDSVYFAVSRSTSSPFYDQSTLFLDPGLLKRPTSTPSTRGCAHFTHSSSTRTTTAMSVTRNSMACPAPAVRVVRTSDELLFWWCSPTSSNSLATSVLPPINILHPVQLSSFHFQISGNSNHARILQSCSSCQNIPFLRFNNMLVCLPPRWNFSMTSFDGETLLIFSGNKPRTLSLL